MQRQTIRFQCTVAIYRFDDVPQNREKLRVCFSNRICSSPSFFFRVFFFVPNNSDCSAYLYEFTWTSLTTNSNPKKINRLSNRNFNLILAGPWSDSSLVSWHAKRDSIGMLRDAVELMKIISAFWQQKFLSKNSRDHLASMCYVMTQRIKFSLVQKWNIGARVWRMLWIFFACNRIVVADMIEDETENPILMKYFFTIHSRSNGIKLRENYK